MKIRLDFVTNSSSSSYICIAKVDMCDELRKYIKNEFGNFGARLLNENVKSGEYFKSHSDNYATDFFEEYPDEIEDNSSYVLAEFIEYTSEGDTEGEAEFLYRHIPSRFLTEIHNEAGY